MIFVTVGTHEQGFDRLIRSVDEQVGQGFIMDQVVMQSGYSSYIPKNCEYEQFLSAGQMHQYIEDADVVITHGGPASFIDVLRADKIPIVAPRLKKFGEHINNHQLTFCQEAYKSGYPIDIVTNFKKIPELLEEVRGKTFHFKSHNKEFDKQLSQLVHHLVG